ncbi:hypothetical protein DYQ86_17780 [Acidobacteria bacterium AB60]|nr:hypothetical protein DYQ86_17780 [Acidobacteria bacterium AB60]
MLRVMWWLFVLMALAFGMKARADQDARQFVQQAVNDELAKDEADHSHWIYFEKDQKGNHQVKQWVAETKNGNLKRVVQMDGQAIAPDEQRRRLEAYLRDSGSQTKQRKSEQHDDKQAEEMLQLLPKAFLWTNEGEKGSNRVLHFKPDPNFRPPDMEARVFAAMEGDMLVDTKEHRIASLKGKLIQDVKIFGGLLGSLNSGGTFDVERRQTGPTVWQITETHVHIQGHALLFHTISEQEDDVKSEFKQLPADITMQQAKGELIEARQ